MKKEVKIKIEKYCPYCLLPADQIKKEYASWEDMATREMIRSKNE